ncbi:chromate transporter [Desulfitispora alkaliphila]|uniref:chromate transporter n=1 Tax=Desulfitispora alkaliphila TaxID=622674 RepID=UPI003D1DD373
MLYWQLFLAFFIPNIVGYGGGPAIIPLIQNEVVTNYGWLSMEEFGELLALGNSLPGPIATKMAGYVGYEIGGLVGAIIAVLATVLPSLAAMIFLMGILYKFKDSPRMKNMTNLVRPAIGILLGILAYEFFFSSYNYIGVVHSAILVIGSYLLLEKIKIHPAFVVLSAVAYGAIFLA